MVTPGLSTTVPLKKIYFVRHGKTDWNNMLRYQGKTDIPLNDEGEAQASMVALRLKNVEIDSIISSPLKRAFVTAKKIAGFHNNIKIKKTALLTEVDFGDWEGKDSKEIILYSGRELFTKWSENPFGVTSPGGEKPDKLFERCEKFIQLLKQTEGKKIVVVGHGAMLRALFLPMLDLPISGLFWKMRIDNCSISSFILDKENRFVLTGLNDVLHLHADVEFAGSIPVN